MQPEQAIYQMMQTVIRGGGVGNLCEAVSAVLNRPVWIVDYNFHGLAFSGAERTAYGTVIKRQLEQESRDEGLMYIHEKRIVQQVDESSMPILYYDEILRLHLIVAAIRIGGVVAGYVCTCSELDSIPEGDETILLAARELIGMDIQRNHTEQMPRKTPLSNVLSEMLELQCADMPHIRSLLKALKYRKRDRYRIVIVSCREEKENIFPWYLIEDRLSRFLPGMITTVFQGKMIALTDGTEPMDAEKRAQFARYFHKNEVHIGISYSFERLDDTYRTYSDTADLLSACERAYPNRCPYLYEDYVTVLAGWLLMDRIHIDSLANGAVRRLSTYDEKYGQELLPTLTVYARAAFDPKRTAEAMHIHVNTLRYRIGRIEELCDIKTDSARTMLDILLALTIHMIEQQSET